MDQTLRGLRGRDNAELLHQPEPIGFPPGFHILAVFKAHNDDAGYGYLFVGGGNIH